MWTSSSLAVGGMTMRGRKALAECHERVYNGLGRLAQVHQHIGVNGDERAGERRRHNRAS